MRHYSVLTLLFLFLSLSVPTRQAAAQDDVQVLDEIVAIVGDYIVLKSDVDGFVLGVMNQQKIPYSDELWQSSLDQLVNEKVLVSHAKRDTNLVVTDAQVNQMLDQRIGQMSNAVGGDKQIEVLYGKSIVELRAELTDDFRNQLLADQLRSTKMRSIKATPSDVEDWFNQFPTDSLPTLPEIIRVSHIVKKPAVTREARDEAREMLTAIRDTVLTGAVKMEQMAELFSDDPGSAKNGGLYEGTPLTSLVPTFAAVASRMQVGVYSQIFETKFGLHFLRVNARRGDVIDYNHILIAFDERKFDETAAIERLQTLRDSIMTAGGSFEGIARSESADQVSAVRGGWVVDPNSGDRDLYLESLDGLWQQTLIPMQVSDVSEPAEVLLQDGTKAFHIVLLQKRLASHMVNIETDYALVEGLALRAKKARIMDEWLSTLKKDVYIDMRGTARGLYSSGN